MIHSKKNSLINTITLLNNILEELKADEVKMFKISLVTFDHQDYFLNLIQDYFHKTKFETRLVINCIKHPSDSLFICLSYLKTIVVNLPSLLKDSQDLLQRLINK
jgi:hypothetical protein